MEGSGQNNGRKDTARRKTLLGIPGPAELSALSPPIDYEPDQGERPSGASPVAESPATAGPVRLPSDQPIVLLVGTGHPMQEALWAALQRHDILCKTATTSSAPISLGRSAPTVVLLLGDGALGGGKAMLESLRSAGLGEAVPVVVLLDDTSLEARLEALRAGASAAIPRSASVDQIARRVSDLARAGDVSRVRGEVVGETTLADLLALVGDELKGRLLPEGTPRVDSRNVRLMLGAGPPLLRSLDTFYEELGRAVLETHPADEDLAHVADADDTAEAPPSAKKSIKGVRLVLADDDSARADQVADELRRRGATVVVTGLSPREERMVRLRQCDPMVLLVRSEDRAAGQALLDAMKGDMRLRWVTLVVTNWDERHGPGQSGQALDALVEQIASTGEADRRLSQAAETGAEVDVKLQDLGPARALRAVSASARPLRFVVDNPRAQISVDLSDGIVTGAVATESDDWAPIGEGPAALKALLSLATGKLSITTVTGPRVLNVMNTVAAALDLAENEQGGRADPAQVRSAPH